MGCKEGSLGSLTLANARNRCPASWASIVIGVSPWRPDTGPVGSVGYWLNGPKFMRDCSREADPYCWPASKGSNPYPVPLERAVLSYATAPVIAEMDMLL